MFVRIGPEFKCSEEWAENFSPQKTGPEFQSMNGFNENSNVYKKGPEFQRLEEKGKNSNVYKNKARSSMFVRMRSKFQYVTK